MIDTPVTQVLTTPPSSKIDSVECPQSANTKHSVQCPCCAESMTVNHVCQDSGDHENFAIPPVPPDPDMSHDKVEAIARVLTMNSTRMIDQLLKNLLK